MHIKCFYAAPELYFLVNGFIVSMVKPMKQICNMISHTHTHTQLENRGGLKEKIKTGRKVT